MTSISQPWGQSPAFIPANELTGRKTASSSGTQRTEGASRKAQRTTGSQRISASQRTTGSQRITGSQRTTGSRRAKPTAQNTVLERFRTRINMLTDLRFRVSHKGLILVGVPLLFELILVGSTFALLNKAEESASKALHSRQVCATANKLTADALVVSDICDQNYGPGRINVPELKAQGVVLLQDFRELKKLVKHDPAHLKWVTEASASISALKEQSDVITEAYENGDFVSCYQQAMKTRSYFRSMAQSGGIRRLSVIAAETQKMEVGESQQEVYLRNCVKVLLGLGVLCSIVLGVSLANFFSGQITRRISIITDNHARLLAGSKLNPLVSGSDEISALDQAFHAMCEELLRARQREQEVQRLRSQVMAMVTHDLRAPLQTVATFLEFAEGQLPDPNAERLRTMADRNVNHMSQLMNDFLDLEKMNSGTLSLNKSTFKISAAVADAREIVFSMLKHKNVNIISRGDASIYADRQRIVQTLANLLNNAIKYSPEDTCVTIYTTARDGAIKIEIADQGRGIPQGMEKQIFLPFQQVEQADTVHMRGIGLGLAICKSLVSLHGGRIWASKNVGLGSTFSILVPSGFDD